jgi:hypothetical protein
MHIGQSCGWQALDSSHFAMVVQYPDAFFTMLKVFFQHFACHGIFQKPDFLVHEAIEQPKGYLVYLIYN